jgi:2-keto-3-deoxy-6-phosphogluconate aldolase
LKNVASVGGSWITPPGLLATRDFDAISQLASEAARL